MTNNHKNGSERKAREASLGRKLCTNLISTIIQDMNEHSINPQH